MMNKWVNVPLSVCSEVSHSPTACSVTRKWYDLAWIFSSLSHSNNCFLENVVDCDRIYQCIFNQDLYLNKTASPNSHSQISKLALLDNLKGNLTDKTDGMNTCLLKPIPPIKTIMCLSSQCILTHLITP